jgi:hypothetical protein
MGLYISHMNTVSAKLERYAHSTSISWIMVGQRASGNSDLSGTSRTWHTARPKQTRWLLAA